MENTIYGLPKPNDSMGLMNIIHQLLKVEYKQNQPVIPGYIPIMEEQINLARLIIDAIITANSVDPNVVWDVVLEMQRRDNMDDSAAPDSNNYTVSWGGR